MYQLKLFASLAAMGIVFWSVRLLGMSMGWWHYSFAWALAVVVIGGGTWRILAARGRVLATEQRRVTGWTFFLWLLIGIFLIKWHALQGRAVEPIDLFFLVYTILLADSYFEFSDVRRAYKHLWTKNG